ncbi:YciI family protein [Radicibacter daui]|uniref:YciI family protein n=1 Tax=Radicibacter daui TaxID=3064829 RepID=UPI004046CADC
MFVIQLKFIADKAAAQPLMAGHQTWIQRGFDDGVFLMTGNLQPGPGGGILAHNLSRPELEARLAEDPFVAEGLVSTEIAEITPGRTDARLGFLAG